MSWYGYSSTDSIIRHSASSFGGQTPTITMANESGLLIIHLDNDKTDQYFNRFNVRVYDTTEPASDFEGWVWGDEAVTGNKVVTVPYVNRMGNLYLDGELVSNTDINSTGGDICITGGNCLSDIGSGFTSFTLSGDSGSETIADGNTVSVSGGSGITTTASATDTLTVAVTADSIGDTQLAFNTGQALTTGSSPTFTDLTLSGNDLKASSDLFINDIDSTLVNIENANGISNSKPSSHPLLLSLIYSLSLGTGGFIWLYLLTNILIKYRDKIKVEYLKWIIRGLSVALFGISIYLFWTAFQIIIKQIF